jgi:hypothetical protein
MQEEEPMIAKTTIRIDTELLKKAQHRCIDEEITFQELIDKAVRDYLKKPLEKKGVQK